MKSVTWSLVIRTSILLAVTMTGMVDLEDYDPLQREQGRYKQKVQQTKNSFHHNMQF